MSLKAILWAWDDSPSHLTAPEVSVLTALAEYVNDHTHECWPSINPEMMRRTRLSESAVKRALRVFELSGIITRQRRHARSMLYVWHPDRARKQFELPVREIQRVRRGKAVDDDALPMGSSVDGSSVDPETVQCGPRDRPVWTPEPVSEPVREPQTVGTDRNQPFGPVETVDNVGRDAGCPIHVGAKRRPDGECSGCWADRVAGDAEPVSVSS